MKIRKAILLIIFVQCVLSCNRPNPTACFTVNKSTVNVGDTIIFTNCSEYDGGSTYTIWQLGDTQIVNNGENVQRVYNISKQYIITISIGGRSDGDSQSKKIIIQ
ncbi:MAG: hypothetical protein A2X08_07205 [Bacteroidetes bacterium GWA2_32_17]|nr:MAG: hypothetical protein A2X08_07205 [Bacteroidetes bacterium GWA2_32_17]